MGVVDDGGACGDDQGRGFACGVDAVTFGDLVGVTLRSAAGGADFFRSIDVVFEWAFRENHGADVAALHNEWSDGLKGALSGDERIADFDDRSDMRDGAIDGITIEFFGGEEVACNGDGGLAIDDSAVDRGTGAEGCDGRGV